MYSAPAGTRPTGADRIHPTDAVLPNGRIAAPAGTSIFVGSNPLGLTLSTDGRFAILSNGGMASGWSLTAPPDTPITSSASLTVVDTRTMRIASVYHAPATSFFMGVASARDPGNPAQAIVLASDGAAGKVRIFNLDSAGTLSEVTAIALSADPARRAFPAQIAVTPDNRTAYVADNLGNSVIAIDIASRAVQRSVPVGRFSALRCRRKVQRRGIRHGSCCLRTGRAAGAPAAVRRSQLSIRRNRRRSPFSKLPAEARGDPTTVPMDAAPDGSKVVGGAAPGAAVITPRRKSSLRRDGKRRSHLGRCACRSAARRARLGPAPLPGSAVRRAAECRGAQPRRKASVRCARGP